MTIIFQKDSFFFSLFGLAEAASDEEITLKIQEAFTELGVTVEIHIGEEISIKTSTEQQDRSKSIERVANLASNGDYNQALDVIEKELRRHPTLSELYRMRGQILSDQGDQDGGVDNLIDALRFDPKNKWALIMMGNIFARERGDVETGMIYYRKALEVDPKDNIALNNIGAMLLESGNEEEGLKMFRQALEIDPSYGNTYLGFSMAYQRQEEYLASFQWSIDGLKNSDPKSQVREVLLQNAVQTAQVVLSQNDGIKTAKGFAAQLEEQSRKEIRFEESDQIPFTAKLELAENHGRDFHYIRYKPGSPAVAHLLLHELMHLELVVEARATGENELFITSKNHELAFKSRLGKYIKKLKKLGFGADSVDGVIDQLFSGLNSQVYNTPIDQFIEQRIYERFPQLRPHQFLSLMQLMKEGVEAVTRKEIVELSDPWVLDRSKTYNIVNALGLKHWYGVDLTKQLKPTRDQYQTGKKLFSEFVEYVRDKHPAEEYDLVNNWADELKLLPFFELVEEKEYRSNQADPIHEPAPDLITESTVPEDIRQEEMRTFQEQHGKDLNMAVVMFMVDAIRRYKAMKKDKVRAIAFQIAQIGINGISPEKDGYHVPLIPGSDYSGYQMLANYYVSWAIAVPEMLSQIGMPFEAEYATATQLAGRG